MSTPTQKPGFGAVAYAARHRDAIERIVRSVLNRERPQPKIGKVFDFDTATLTALILFPGETQNSLVSVKFSPNNIPTRAIAQQPEWITSNVDDETNDTLLRDLPGDIVRIWGAPGQYYIDSFVYGEPASLRYDTAVIPIGGIIDWPTDTPPTFAVDNYSVVRFLPCDGSMQNPADYPLLFAKLGTSIGGDGVDTFQLPRKLGEWDDIDLDISDNWIDPSSGWSMSQANLCQRGNVVTINLVGSRTGADQPSNASGDIGNIGIGTILDSRFWPMVQSPVSSGSTGRMLLGYITTDAGLVAIASTVPNVSINTGNGWSLNSTYAVNGPGNRLKMIRAA